MSYIIFTYDISLLDENPLFHAAAVQSTESPQWTTKPRLITGKYTVMLTVVDMYTIDDLGLILLCGGLTCNELTAHKVACSP